MIIAFGKWCGYSGFLFRLERVYTKSGKWTPFCMVKLRNTKEKSIVAKIDELIIEAQNEPAWTAEQALKCLRKEILDTN